jgi:hypothetical protein
MRAMSVAFGLLLLLAVFVLGTQMAGGRLGALAVILLLRAYGRRNLRQ